MVSCHNDVQRENHDHAVTPLHRYDPLHERRTEYNKKRPAGILTGILAGMIAIPAGFWFAARTELSLAVIGAAVLFLPLFVFLPRLVRYAMKTDTDAVLDAFGKNDQV
jgi:hypothetical protein